MKTTLVLFKPWDWTLVKNWRQVPKKISVQALALAGLIQSIVAIVPQSKLDYRIPFADFSWGELGVAASVAITVIGLVGAYIDQQIPPVDPPPPPAA